MATGEVNTGPEGEEPGEVLMDAGRLSVARRIEPDRPVLPFSPGQLAQLDEALSASSSSTGLEFAVYLGDLGEETRQRAEQLHAGLGARAAEGVLIAVSPGQRAFELITGEQAFQRVPDRSCQLAAMSMVASFREDELLEGIISGLRMLSDAAGSR